MSTAYLVNTDTGDTTANYHSLLTLSSDIGVGIPNDLAALGGVDISCKAGTGVDDICVTGSYQTVFNSGAYINADATNFINLHSITPHNGSFSSGYRINVPSSAWYYAKVIGLSSYQIIDGLNFFIDPSRSSSGVHAINAASGGGDNETFKNCILDVPATGISLGGSGTRPYFLYNNIIKAAQKCVRIANYPSLTKPSHIYNNLFIGSALGLEVATGYTDGVKLENNVFLNCVTDVDDPSAYIAATTTNATTQATNSYGSIVNLSTVDGVEFVAPSANDYHLVSGSSLIGAGTNLTTYLTTDIDGETWPATGAWDIGADHYVVVSLFNDTVKQAILSGITSAQTETLGWNNEVRDKESVTSVVRTSPTVVTITLSAAAAYDITVPEEITVTIPASALTGGVAIDGLPAFTVVALPSQIPCAQAASIPDSKLFMPELLIPGRKPVGNVRIDWSHSLTRGLVFYSIFTSDNPLNLASRSRITPSITVGTPSFSGGNVVYATADRHYFDIPELASAGRTFAARVKPSSVSGSRYMMNIHGASSIYDFIAWMNTSNFRVNFGSSANGYAQALASLSVNTWYDLAATIPASNLNADVVLFIDGAVASKSTGADGTPVALKDTIEIAGRSTNNRDWGGTVEYMAFWNRELSANEYYSFVNNPYQILIPA